MSKNLSDIFPPTEIGGGGGGIEEAPKTGKIYGRKDEAWQEFETADIEPGGKDGETLAWSTADAEYMPNDTLIVKGGNVGIGIDPVTNLHVKDVGELRFDASSGAHMQFCVDTTPTHAWSVGTQIPGQASEDSFHLGHYPDSSGWVSRLTIDEVGSVGIGTRSVDILAPLHVDGASSNGVAGYLRLQNETSGTGYTGVYFSADPTYAKQAIYARRENPNGSGPLIFAVDSDLDAADVAIGDEKMRLDAVGRLGIGGTPTRSTKEIEDEAVATLANWDSKDKKPTKAELIKRLTERNIGGGDALLQVAGDGYFSGTVAATNASFGAVLATSGDVERPTHSGVHFSTNFWVPIDSTRVLSDGKVDLGNGSLRFKDAHFSGTVYANGSALTRNKDLIETLSTLRAATQDETTLEGLRDSIGNAIGGLIEKFEAMQNTAEMTENG